MFIKVPLSISPRIQHTETDQETGRAIVSICPSRVRSICNGSYNTRTDNRTRKPLQSTLMIVNSQYTRQITPSNILLQQRWGCCMPTFSNYKSRNSKVHTSFCKKYSAICLVYVYVLGQSSKTEEVMLSTASAGSHSRASKRASGLTS